MLSAILGIQVIYDEFAEITMWMIFVFPIRPKKPHPCS